MSQLTKLSKLFSGPCKMTNSRLTKFSTNATLHHGKEEDPTEAACNRASKKAEQSNRQAEILKTKTPIGKTSQI